MLTQCNDTHTHTHLIQTLWQHLCSVLFYWCDRQRKPRCRRLTTCQVYSQDTFFSASSLKYHTKMEETPADLKQVFILCICMKRIPLCFEFDLLFLYTTAYHIDSKRFVFLDLSEMKKMGPFIVRISDAK